MFRTRMVKKSSRRVNPVQLVTSVFRRPLFSVGEQIELAEHFGIDLLAELIQPPMLIRRESNRSVPVALESVGFQPDQFRVQPFDLALLITAALIHRSSCRRLLAVRGARSSIVRTPLRNFSMRICRMVAVTTLNKRPRRIRWSSTEGINLTTIACC